MFDGEGWVSPVGAVELLLFEVADGEREVHLDLLRAGHCIHPA